MIDRQGKASMTVSTVDQLVDTTLPDYGANAHISASTSSQSTGTFWKLLNWRERTCDWVQLKFFLCVMRIPFSTIPPYFCTCCQLKQFVQNLYRQVTNGHRPKKLQSVHVYGIEKEQIESACPLQLIQIQCFKVLSDIDLLFYLQTIPPLCWSHQGNFLPTV